MHFGNNLDSSLETTIKNLDSFITRKKPLLEMWKQKQKMQKEKVKLINAYIKSKINVVMSKKAQKKRVKPTMSLLKNIV